MKMESCISSEQTASALRLLMSCSNLRTVAMALSDDTFALPLLHSMSGFQKRKVSPVSAFADIPLEMTVISSFIPPAICLTVFTGIR